MVKKEQDNKKMRNETKQTKSKNKNVIFWISLDSKQK